MKMKLGLAVLTLCSTLMAGPALAQDINYKWPDAYCDWAGGCRYTYQVPNPPAGKRWELRLWVLPDVNDQKIWMKGAVGRVAMSRQVETGLIGPTSVYYTGAMPTGGEIEFWMPYRTGLAIHYRNSAGIFGHLVNAN